MGKKKEVVTATAEQKVLTPFSRQAARQIMRRRTKQPLDVSQAEWHREKGFSKIARKAKRGASIVSDAVVSRV